MLKWRFLTALILLPLVLGGVFLLPTPWFAAFVGLVVLLAAREWTQMTGLLKRPSVSWAYMALFAVVLTALGLVMNNGALTPLVLALGVFWWFVVLGLLVRFNQAIEPSGPVSPWVGAWVGMVLFVPAWAGLVWLHGQPGGPWLVLLLLVITWSADIGAYFSGRSFGRRKLALRISPGKTWEGALGGMLLALLGAFLMRSVLPLPAMPALLFGLLVAATVMFSIAGDLFESMVKRRAGVKDSGTLLPGHGGVLDRIDSLTATGTMFSAGLYWL